MAARKKQAWIADGRSRGPVKLYWSKKSAVKYVKKLGLSPKRNIEKMPSSSELRKRGKR